MRIFNGLRVGPPNPCVAQRYLWNNDKYILSYSGCRLTVRNHNQLFKEACETSPPYSFRKIKSAEGNLSRPRWPFYVRAHTRLNTILAAHTSSTGVWQWTPQLKWPQHFLLPSPPSYTLNQMPSKFWHNEVRSVWPALSPQLTSLS